MPEQEINPAAAKFISSLVKSLQILCNGQVDFDESIELVGHINVRVDRKYKFDYIVDEHVSKEGEDSSTTFLSNSYHSRPPLKQLNKKPSASELEQEIMFSEIPHNTNRRLRQSKTSNNSVETHQQEESSTGADENNQNYSVSVEPMDRHGDQPNQMVVKLEEADDSNDCMVLPASPGDYEQVEGSEAFPIAGPSASYDESISVHTRRTRKRRKVNDLGAEENSDGMNKNKKRKTRGMEVIPIPKTVSVKMKAKHVSEEDYHLVDQLWEKRSLMCHCKKCSYTTAYRSRVRAHCKSIHMGIPRPYKMYEKGHFICDQCGKDFTSNRGFHTHVLSKHLDKFPYRCEVCSKGFTCKSTHRDHMNMHAGIALQCMGCEHIFTTEYGLRRHIIKKHPYLIIQKDEDQKDINFEQLV